MRVRQRGCIHDVLREGDECVVYVDDDVMVLSAIATTVWSLVGPEWTNIHDLVEIVVRTYGPPERGSAEESVVRVLRELQTVRIVELSEPTA